MFGSSKDDTADPGVSCIFYFAIKPETVRQALLGDDAPPAIKLLKRYDKNIHVFNICVAVTVSPKAGLRLI
jgi:hypothetical protein